MPGSVRETIEHETMRKPCRRRSQQPATLLRIRKLSGNHDKFMFRIIGNLFNLFFLYADNMLPTLDESPTPDIKIALLLTRRSK